MREKGSTRGVQGLGSAVYISFFGVFLFRCLQAGEVARENGSYMYTRAGECFNPNHVKKADIVFCCVVADSSARVSQTSGRGETDDGGE